MTDIVIVDTDILIDSGRGIREAVSFLDQVEQHFTMAISIITQMELIVGCRNKNELQALDHFLLRFELIKINENISDIAGDLLRRYRLSHGLLIADALIASTVIASTRLFITKNQRDYQFIEGLRILSYPDAIQIIDKN